jgi:hypothetical protein
MRIQLLCDLFQAYREANDVNSRQQAVYRAPGMEAVCIFVLLTCIELLSLPLLGLACHKYPFRGNVLWCSMKPLVYGNIFM